MSLESPDPVREVHAARASVAGFHDLRAMSGGARKLVMWRSGGWL